MATPAEPRTISELPAPALAAAVAAARDWDSQQIGYLAPAERLGGQVSAAIEYLLDTGAIIVARQ